VAFILALDQGTTSSRAIVFDDHQRVVGSAQRPFEQLFPHPGWVEHDPLEIWQTQRDVALEALADANIDRADISGVGITNQRETTVVWDRRTGRPVYNAIVWQDRRTADLCRTKRNDGHEPTVHRVTGLLLDPYFSASKICWILDNCEGARDAATAGHLAFGTIDTWLIWQLTDGRSHITDPSNASRTCLFNLETRQWDDSMLELWDIPRSMLPEITQSSGIVARCATTELDDIAIAGIAGDQQAALFGQTCFSAGDAKCTYGTGCFILINSGERLVRSKNRLLTTVAWTIDGRTEYALEGSVFVGGAVVQWLRDGLEIIDQSGDIETLAAGVEGTDGVVFVPAFAGLGAPYWDPEARGTIIGITRGTTKGHLARAGLEGIAFQVADVLCAMQTDIDGTLTTLKVDGGASANNLLMQLQSDILQTSLIRPGNHESTALGAASLAGLALGVWQDRDELRALWREARRFLPEPMHRDLENQRALWHRAVERARHWLSDSGTA
jgi:glycerol kinase